MARIVVVTLGSWGDLFPLVGLAAELGRRGHGAVVAASPAWEEVVAGAGVPFAGVGRWIGFDEFREHPEIFGRVPGGLRQALGRFLFDQVDELTADLRAVMEGCDLVVSHPAHVVALNLAEQLDVPVAVATVFPGMVPSAHTVPGGVRAGPWRGRAGRAANRALWGLTGASVAALFDRPVNRHRRRLGLAPVRAALLRLPMAHDVVVMASPAIIVPPPDWPASVTVTSFVAWDRGGGHTVSWETEAFLAAGPAPVLVTLGTSTALVADGFFGQAAAAVRAEGRRVLVVSGPGGVPAVPGASDGVRVTPFEPFGAVAPRCTAAVHHGGIGTAVACLRAGIPQLVVPRCFDQPDTAALLVRLGAGVAVPWDRRRRHLGPAVRRLLTEPALARRAADLAGRLAGEEGAAATADVVERLAARPR